MKRLPILAMALVTIGGVATQSQAFAPVNQNEQYEIKLQAFELFEYRTPELTLVREQAARETVNQFGGKWGVYSYNPQAKSASAVFGSGYETGMRVDTEASAELAAREVLSRNSVALGVDTDNLRLSHVADGLGKVGVHFQQMHDGLEVLGGRAHALFMESGRVFVMGADYYNGIDLDVNPVLSIGEAERIAQDAVPFNPATDSVESTKDLFILPVPTSHETVDYRLVWQVRVGTQEPLGIWVTDVDAHTGEIVQRMNDIHFLDVGGTTTGDWQDITYCNGETDDGAHSYMEVNIPGVGITASDINGDWTVPYTGTDDRTLTSRFYGPYCNVNVNGAPEASMSTTVTPGVPFQVEWDDTNSRQDERDVFQGVSDIHDLFEMFDPGWWRTNARMTANVNLPGSCNAFFNGSSINFYPEVANCANTGEIEGVVQHEYGHAVQQALLGSQGTQGLGEGNSDILANILTQESIIGRGFNVGACAIGIRDSDNDLQYPEDLVGQVHSDGRIIAGFHWDAMTLFQTLLGDEAGTLYSATVWHFGRKLSTPFNQPQQVLAMFAADDDDGDLTNGTPYYDVWCFAAEEHGYDCPLVTTGILIDHDEELSKLAPNDHVVDADIVSTDGSITSAVVTYRIDGGPWMDVTMDNVGGDSYEGILPGLDHPDQIEYYITVEDDVPQTKIAPGLAPFEVYDFDIAQVYQSMESLNGWSVNDEGTDTATTGQWENVTPISSPIAPGEDTTPGSGSRCWVTENGPVGGGTNEADIDNGETSLFSPTFDMTGATTLFVKMSKWFDNTRTPNPNSDNFTLQVRTDGGPWLDLERSTESTDGWETKTYDILPVIPTPGVLEFKIIAEDSGGPSRVEAAVDDFSILGVLEDVADVEVTDGPVVKFALLGSTPNPAPGATKITYQVPVQAQVSLKVFDVSGREVRQLVNDSVEAGTHVADWDGLDRDGNEVASGVYFYRLEANEYNATRRLILQK